MSVSAISIEKTVAPALASIAARGRPRTSDLGISAKRRQIPRTLGSELTD